jgi:hypothetical protein
MSLCLSFDGPKCRDGGGRREQNDAGRHPKRDLCCIRVSCPRKRNKAMRGLASLSGSNRRANATQNPLQAFTTQLDRRSDVKGATLGFVALTEGGARRGRQPQHFRFSHQSR